MNNGSFFLSMGELNPIIGKKYIKYGNNTYFNYYDKDTGEYELKKFINAVQENRLEEAKSYISDNFIEYIDMDNLRKQISNGISYANFPMENKGDKSMYNETLIFQKEGKEQILNIYMLKELRNWKIVGIDLE